jgi:ascorbate-specific PTS system EIIC-type component UlaA
MKKAAPRIAFLPFKTVDLFVEWFRQFGVSLSGRMKIVIGGKKEDVNEKNADKILEFFDGNSQSMIIPVMLYLGTRGSQALVQFMLRGISACNDLVDVKRFILED